MLNKKAKKINSILADNTIIEKYLHPLFLIFLIFSFFMLMSGITVFFTGFHNLDLGQNLNLISCETGMDYYDINSKLETWTPTEMYIHGFNSMKLGLIISCISMLLFGFSIGVLSRK
jgi:hypothetical protein